MPLTSILYNPATSTGVGIAHDATSYKTIGTSFELGGLTDGVSPSTKKKLVQTILEFFDITLTNIPIVTPENIVPAEFVLEQNFPNPFNNSTNLRFALPTSGNITIAIFTITGQKLYQHDLGKKAAGWHSFEWNGVNQKQLLIASGIYLYRFTLIDSKGNRWTRTGKMQFAK
jgi:hypothetical protein